MPPRTLPRPIRLAAFWAALAFACIMATLPHPPALPGQPGDKVQHVAAFTTLALLGALAYPRMALPRLGLRLSLLGAAIELCQSIPALHRDCSVWDWAADTAAIAVTLTIVAWWRRRAANRQRSEQ